MQRNIKLILFPVLAFFIGSTWATAGEVRLPPRTIKICVKKSSTIIKLKTQAEYWRANGKESNQSTWQYRGSASTLTLDYATADVVAACRVPGTDTYDLAWKLAYQDRNEYQMNYTVICEVCPPPVPVVRGKAAAVKQVLVHVNAARVSLARNN